MEWPKVLLDPHLAPDDFANGPEMSKGELMVSYVAATRAQEVLDATALMSFHERRKRLNQLSKTSAATPAAG